MLHGDFHPGNLFDLGGRVLAFDRKFDRHGSPFLDAARFLLSVAALRDRAAGNGRPWTGNSDSDRRSFFEGWGPLEEPDLPLFDLVEDVALFNRWNRLTVLGDHRLDRQVAARGLLDASGPSSRPGRLVRQAGDTLWTREPAPEPRAGLLSRLFGRWRPSGAAAGRS